MAGSSMFRVLAMVGVLSALLFGSVTAARASTSTHASPSGRISRYEAVLKAKSYLQYESFSYRGLIGQLKYEGFSTSDATYGASHAGANWFKQAAKKAKEYLSFESFSRSGLIQQLEYEKFTLAQAIYGANAVGL